jgi:hypothetical protein
MARYLVKHKDSFRFTFEGCAYILNMNHLRDSPDLFIRCIRNSLATAIWIHKILFYRIS